MFFTFAYVNAMLRLWFYRADVLLQNLLGPVILGPPVFGPDATVVTLTHTCYLLRCEPTQEYQSYKYLIRC
jgi:hypothetical protein